MGFEDDFPRLTEGGGYYRFFTNNPTSYLERNFNNLYKAAETTQNTKPQPNTRLAVCLSGFNSGETQGDALGETAAKRVVIRRDNSPEPFVTRQIKIWFCKAVGDKSGDHWTSQISYPGDADTPDQSLSLIKECPYAYAESEELANIPVGFLDVLKIYQQNGVYYYSANTGRKFEELGNWFLKGYGATDLAGASGAFTSGTNKGGPEATLAALKDSPCETRVCDPFSEIGSFGDPNHEKTKADGTVVATDGLPCSALTAIWVMNQLGMKPKYKKDAQGNTIYDWQAWYRLDKVMWNRINMTSGGEGDTYCIPYIQSLLGGTITNYPRVNSDVSESTPHLTAGRWHVIQRWGKWGGHSYLVYYGGGMSVRKVQSSRKFSYRDQQMNKNGWYEEGAQEMVLTLPIGMLEIEIAGLGVFQISAESDEFVEDAGSY